MKWFSQERPAQQPASTSKYTVDKVTALLDQFGPLRLEVTDVTLKIMISRIAWGVLPYLTTSSNGPPGAAVLAETITTLEMLTQTLQTYITIQNSFQNDTEEMLLRGYRAIETYAEKISAPASDLAAEKVSYTALTDYLTGNQPI